MARQKNQRDPIILAPEAGREYAMGPVRAVFKADGAQTRGQYSISEWWLEPYTKGPGTHQHDADDRRGVLSRSVWSSCPRPRSA